MPARRPLAYLCTEFSPFISQLMKSPKHVRSTCKRAAKSALAKSARLCHPLRPTDHTLLQIIDSTDNFQHLLLLCSSLYNTVHLADWLTMLGTAPRLQLNWFILSLCEQPSHTVRVGQINARGRAVRTSGL